MRDLCESHAAYSKGIVCGIGRGLGSRLLYSRLPVDHSSEGDGQTTCGIIVIRASSKVRINITSKWAFSYASECTLYKCSSDTQSPVLRAVTVPKHLSESYHMLIAWVVIVPAENSDGICDIGPSGGHRLHKAYNHQSVYGRIAGFFVALALMKLNCHRRGNWAGVDHSELRHDRPNVAALMNVDCVMLPIAFDVHAEIEGDTLEIMHPEPLLHVIIDLPNQALVNNDTEIIDLQNDWRNDCALISKHEQSSVDNCWHEPNRDHEVLQRAVPNVRRLISAVMRLSQA
jgi:hypothetical protein